MLLRALEEQFSEEMIPSWHCFLGAIGFCYTMSPLGGAACVSVQKFPKISPLPRQNLGTGPNLKNAMWATRNTTSSKNFAKKISAHFRHKKSKNLPNITLFGVMGIFHSLKVHNRRRLMPAVCGANFIRIGLSPDC